MGSCIVDLVKLKAQLAPLAWYRDAKKRKEKKSEDKKKKVEKKVVHFLSVGACRSRRV